MKTQELGPWDELLYFIPDELEKRRSAYAIIESMMIVRYPNELILMRWLRLRDPSETLSNYETDGGRIRF